MGEGSFRMYLGPCEENGQGRYVGKQTQLGRRPARASQGRLPEIPVLTFTEQVSEDSSWGAWDRLCRTWGCCGLPAPRCLSEEVVAGLQASRWDRRPSVRRWFRPGRLRRLLLASGWAPARMKAADWDPHRRQEPSCPRSLLEQPGPVLGPRSQLGHRRETLWPRHRGQAKDRRPRLIGPRPQNRQKRGRMCRCERRRVCLQGRGARRQANKVRAPKQGRVQTGGPAGRVV